MPCHGIEDDAGLYRFIPDSKNITIIVISLLFQTLYFTGITIFKKLCFSLAATAVRESSFNMTRGEG